MAQTVIGFFDSESEAQRAVNELESKGITRDRIDYSRNSGLQQSSGEQVSRDRDRDGENGITRFFRNLFGGDDDEADRYSRVGNNAQCLVTVHARTSDEAERAADILDDCGAIDVDERSSRYATGSDSRTGVSGVPGGSDRSRDRDNTIERAEERLDVGKRTEEGGGIRVRSRIVERPVEEHVRLREEHVHVERNPVNRPVSGDRDSAFQERDIELTERSEIPVVNKEARVVEEIRVSKDVDERDETIRDTVRNTEVDIDRVDDQHRTDRNYPGADRSTGSSDLRNDPDRDRLGGGSNSGL
jgi:stress response protein YsnF